VARWGGWGAGPAGAGSQGPSKAFLVVALAFSAGLTLKLISDGKGWEAGAAGCAAVYFALRASGVLGRRSDDAT
jgi:hypothetical protein